MRRGFFSEFKGISGDVSGSFQFEAHTDDTEMRVHSNSKNSALEAPGKG